MTYKIRIDGYIKVSSIYFVLRVLSCLFDSPKNETEFMIEDVIDLGDIPHEKLSFGVEKIIKEHQNERAKMQEMGPLVPINDTESNITDMTTTALPIPLRRQRYNSSKLQSLMFF